jgi:hypothetical protein
MTSTQENNNATQQSIEEREAVVSRMPASKARRLRVYAAANDVTVQAIVEDLVTKFLDRKGA